MTTHLGLGPTLRTTKRARDILAVLVRYGFADLAEDLGMRRAWSFVRRLLHRPPMPDPGPEEVRIRRMLEELGPTFVKLGQVLSTRPDLVSETWCEEFRKLQSEAPSVPFEAMEVELRRELGERLDTLLASVDPEPIAAASIAQVHRAVRADGQRIVLKVLRPGVRGTIEADVRLMRRLAVLAERRLSSIGFSPVEVVDPVLKPLPSLATFDGPGHPGAYYCTDSSANRSVGVGGPAPGGLDHGAVEATAGAE